MGHASSIELNQLNVTFETPSGPVYAVRDATVSFHPGQTTGLIGESGSGKSVLGMSILGLLPQNAKISGTCMYQKKDLFQLDRRALRRLRGEEIALIPQNPAESLNPVRKIGRQLTEAVTCHRRGSRRDAEQQGKLLLHRLGFEEPEQIWSRYSFQLSGGMNQRVISALGLMCSPAWVIADEPTKGLDAILRRQVYEVLRAVIEENPSGGMLVITHDIPLAQRLCDRLLILYMGQILEEGDTSGIITAPRHPYTTGLLGAIPSRGMTPIPRPCRETGTGCAFYARCPLAEDRCGRELPPLCSAGEGRKVRCFRYA